MPWYCEKVIKNDGSVVFMYPYRNAKPKPVDPWEQVEIDPRPGNGYELINDGKDNPVWELSGESVKSIARRKRGPRLKKVLDIIDQYRNEKEQSLRKVITEEDRKITDEQFKDALTYLQVLRTWPDESAKKLDPSWEPKPPDSLSTLM